MSRTAIVLGLSFLLFAPRARAQEVLEGEVPSEGDYFVIPFEVPEGVVEIEVRHDDLSDVNILDWGLFDPSGFRGYGGGNGEPAIVGIEAASRSYLPGPITPGTWNVYVGKARVDETPARYRVEIVLRDTATLAPQPERAPYAPVDALETGARWYAGDFHVHSRESGDASGTLDEIAMYAESIDLDFVMLSEHNTTSQLELYASTQAAHPALLLVPGIEVTTYQGHAMSLGGTTWIDHRLGYEGITMAEIAGAVRDDGALFSINHPSLSLGEACIGCAWSATLDGAAIDAIEIQTGALSVTSLFLPRTIMRWEELVAAGHHVVALGGSDDHRAGMGTGTFDSPIGSPTTMVWAEELSVGAILDGVRRGRTVVKLGGPDDPMIELSSPELGSESDTIVADTVTFRVRVTGAALGASVRLVRSGVPGEEIEVVGDPFEHETTMIAGASENFVRAELLIGGRPRVITSHVFVRPSTPGGPDAGVVPDAGAVGEPGGGGCSCRAMNAPSNAGAWAMLALAIVIARRRA
ncbi:CehA/McbA family metallohydrolase [Sandaracinus amylolyticus]|uniref:Polymerase/histidinol phosphatase N-terminal domain-containing protein n=1 Tax=Sandaracinus amylolyticus TaxID=927083 RepID=A0A0F6YGP3_9BACT|nr:CehA/McbA family metallohydrolase [Sandaracinus amylolyticus]AKF04170.1 hypothetical protein DB32_001319 [Sandaracinus amylolyticus]